MDSFFLIILSSSNLDIWKSFLIFFLISSILFLKLFLEFIYLLSKIMPTNFLLMIDILICCVIFLIKYNKILNIGKTLEII